MLPAHEAGAVTGRVARCSGLPRRGGSSGRGVGLEAGRAVGPGGGAVHAAAGLVVALETWILTIAERSV